ncbi:MAG: hypothetical protein ACXWFI_03590 [Methylobacter sp.]
MIALPHCKDVNETGFVGTGNNVYPRQTETLDARTVGNQVELMRSAPSPYEPSIISLSAIS